MIDVTPGWHAPTEKLIAIGAKILYTASRATMPRYTIDRGLYETSYATYDPKANRWTSCRELAVPETDGKFFRIGCGLLAVAGAVRRDAAGARSTSSLCRAATIWPDSALPALTGSR